MRLLKEKRRYRWRVLLFMAALFSGLTLVPVVQGIFAQEKAAETPAAAAAAAEASAGPAAAQATALPDYYDGHATDKNGDGKIDDKDAKWPDPTGGSAGYWTTPAAAPGDDDPSKIPVSGLYDRISHNLYSINFVWT